jgi:hypothetical protein
VNDDQLEQLLNRYRPVGPPDDWLSPITGSSNHPIAKSPRAWPWAIAAAALLVITIGLHVLAFVPSHQPESAAAADIAQQLGGDALADRAAHFIVASQALRAVNEDQRSWDSR